MAKVLFQIYIEPEQRDYLEKLAKESGRSRASFIREMIDILITNEKKEESK